MRDAILDCLTMGQPKMWSEVVSFPRNVLWLDGQTSDRLLRHIIGRLEWLWLYDTIRQFEQCNASMAIAGRPLISYFPARQESENVAPMPLANMGLAINALSNNLKMRRFVTTAGGRFGMTAKTAQIGDEIFVLLGCRLPLLLRPCPDDGTYRLIGECHIPGVMEGEAMPWVESGRCTVETVVLSWV